MPNHTGRPKVFCTHKCANAFFNPERYRGIGAPAGMVLPHQGEKRRCAKKSCNTPMPAHWTKKRCIRCEVQVRVQRSLSNTGRRRKKDERIVARLAAHDILASPPRELSIEE
jgi:hypothetical protein